MVSHLASQKFIGNLHSILHNPDMPEYISLNINGIGSCGSTQYGVDAKNLTYIWALSLMFGIAATISRLLDFRWTAEKIKADNKFDDTIIRCAGCITWVCFWGQLISYTCGALYFLIKCV